MTMFIEGLDASVKPMVSQCRQDDRDVFFLRLVNYAKTHGSAGRSRERKPKKVSIKHHHRCGREPTAKSGPHPEKSATLPTWPTQFLGQKNEAIRAGKELVMETRLSPRAILLVHRTKTDTEKMVRSARRQFRRARIRKARIRKPRIPC